MRGRAWTDRPQRLSLAPVRGSADPERLLTARVGADIQVEVGHGVRLESSPLGRPVVAAGAWQGDTFLADVRSPLMTRPGNASTGRARCMTPSLSAYLSVARMDERAASSTVRAVSTVSRVTASRASARRSSARRSSRNAWTIASTSRRAL